MPILAPNPQQKRIAVDSNKLTSALSTPTQPVTVAKTLLASPAKVLNQTSSPIPASVSTRHSLSTEMSKVVSTPSTPANQVVTRKRSAEVVIPEPITTSVAVLSTRRSTRQSGSIS